MDSVILQQAGVSAGFLSVLLLVYRGLVWANHRKIASRCCGRTAEIELDIEGLSGVTPPPAKQEPQKKNEATDKDVGSDDHGNTTSSESTSETGHSHQTNC